MTLIDEWKATVKRAWSMRFAYLAAAFQLAQVYLPEIQDALPQMEPFLPAHLFSTLSGLCTIGIVVSRLVHQPEMRK